MNENINLKKLQRMKAEIDGLKLKYNAVISHTEHLTFSFDYSKRKMEWFGAIKKVTGYGKDEFLELYKSNWMKMIHHDDFKRMCNVISKAMKKGGSYSVEYRILRKDNVYRNIEEKGKVVKIKKNNVLLVIGTMADITDKVIINEKLNQSENRYKYFITNSSEGIYRIALKTPVDLKGDPLQLFDKIRKQEYIAECNDIMAKMYGYQKSSDIIGFSPYSFHRYKRSKESKENLNLRRKKFMKVLVKSKFITVDALTVEYDKSGNKKYFLNNVVGIIEDNKLYGFWGTQRDITKMKENEDLALIREKQLMQTDKMATLGTLATGIAHEINNPNNFIMLNAQILKTAWSDLDLILRRYYKEHGDFSLGGLPYSVSYGKIKELVSGLEEGSARIKKIVSGLKEFGVKTDSEKLSVDLNEIINSAIILTENMIKKCTQNFSFKPQNKIPSVYGNKQQLEQVIINLLTNACQALHDNSKSITIKTALSVNKKFVVITIKDEGVGISKTNLQHIFDPFFTTKRDIGGTGLGLSISQSIIKEHNGKIEYSSKLGKGTIAKIELPAEIKGETNEKSEK